MSEPKDAIVRDVKKPIKVKDKGVRAANKPIMAAIRGVFTNMCRKDKVVLPLSGDLKKVMTWGKLNQAQACLFSYFVVEAINGEKWSYLSDLQNNLDLVCSDFAEVMPDLDFLLKKGYFHVRYDMAYTPFSCDMDFQFIVPSELQEDIMYNRPCKLNPPTQKIEGDCITYLSRAARETYKDKYNYYEGLINTFYKDDEILKSILEAEDDELLDRPMRLKLFTLFGINFLHGESKIPVKETVEGVSDCISPAEVVRIVKSFKEETNWFIKKGIFKLEKNTFGNDISVSWGEVAKEKIFKGDMSLYLANDSVKELGLIRVEDIKEKQLFYNESNMKDVERLSALVEEEKFQEMRARLSSKNLSTGLTILLYGSPGTGKTETVMQIAKQTGRNVFHMNIQEIRSCWVGESEKNIKKVFETYRNSRFEKKPILLFNEADAIISKRSSLDGDNNPAVTKMENAIQNIILEELENFDGIFCATTNMTVNIDSAFDRRLLFKLKFENPTIEVKEQIWMNKLNFLTKEEAKTLAMRFDLSGGQIDNIVRKVELDDLLYGKTADLKTLIDFCEKEKLDNQSRSIGFFN